MKALELEHMEQVEGGNCGYAGAGAGAAVGGSMLKYYGSVALATGKAVSWAGPKAILAGAVFGVAAAAICNYAS